MNKQSNDNHNPDLPDSVSLQLNTALNFLLHKLVNKVWFVLWLSFCSILFLLFSQSLFDHTRVICKCLSSSNLGKSMQQESGQLLLYFKILQSKVTL